MNVDRLVLTFAGIFILTSLVLSKVSSSHCLLFRIFVETHLFQASFTGVCPLAKILKAMGVKAATFSRFKTPTGENTSGIHRNISLEISLWGR
jgi:hypothetical protein